MLPQVYQLSVQFSVVTLILEGTKIKIALCVAQPALIGNLFLPHRRVAYALITVPSVITIITITITW